MREIFKSGSVGRAPGNRCLYPEYRLSLTDEGKQRAKRLGDKASFAPLVERMREIKKIFGSKSGSTLKKLIYRLFDEEIRRRPMGEVIKS